MLLDVGCELSFTIPAASSMVLMLNLHPSIVANCHGSESLHVEPPLPMSEYIDLYGNRCTRIFAPAGRVSVRHSALCEDSGQADPQVWNVYQHPVQNLPYERFAGNQVAIRLDPHRADRLPLTAADGLLDAFPDGGIVLPHPRVLLRLRADKDLSLIHI